MGRMPRSALGRVSMPQAKQEPDTRPWNIADLRAVCLVMVQVPSCRRYSKPACSCPPDACSQVSQRNCHPFTHHFVWLFVLATPLNAEAISANGSSLTLWFYDYKYRYSCPHFLFLKKIKLLGKHAAT